MKRREFLLGVAGGGLLAALPLTPTPAPLPVSFGSVEWRAPGWCTGVDCDAVLSVTLAMEEWFNCNCTIQDRVAVNNERYTVVGVDHSFGERRTTTLHLRRT